MMNRKDAELLVAALRAFVRAEIANDCRANAGVVAEDTDHTDDALVEVIMRMPPMEAAP